MNNGPRSFGSFRNLNLSSDRNPDAAAALNDAHNTMPAPEEKVAAPDVPMDPTPAKKEKAAPQKSPPKAKPGRTKKNNEPISNEDTTLVGIYLETDMHIWLKTYVIRTKSNVSKVVRRWAAAARYYSYQCTNPACQCEFMLDQAGSDDPQEPVACPVCQGKIAKAVKR